jgi:hypothetical protein
MYLTLRALWLLYIPPALLLKTALYFPTAFIYMFRVILRINNN